MVFLLLMFILSVELGVLLQSLSVGIAVIASAIFIKVTAGKQSRDRFWQYFFIYGIQVLFVVLLYYGYLEKFGVPYYGGGSDDLRFEQVSRNLLEQGKCFHQISAVDVYRASNGQSTFSNSRGFLILLMGLQGISDALGGYHTLVPRLFNMALWFSTAILTEKIYNHLRKEDEPLAPRWLVPLLAVFPNAMYISAHVFRDSLSTWFIVLSFYMVLNIFDKTRKLVKWKRRWFVVLLFVLAYLSWKIRTENLYYIGMLIVVSALFAAKPFGVNLKNRRFMISFLMFASALIIILFATGLSAKILHKIYKYADYRRVQTEGLSKYIFDLPILPFGWFARTIFALASPLPVHLLSPGKLFTDPMGLVNILISIGTVSQIMLYPYLFKNRRSDETCVLFWVILLSISVVTFTFRHFIMIYPFLGIIFARNYIQSDSKQKRHNLLLMTTIILTFALIYSIAKVCLPI